MSLGGNWLWSRNVPSLNPSILPGSFSACNRLWNLFHLQNQGPAAFWGMHCNQNVHVETPNIALKCWDFIQVNREGPAWKIGVRMHTQNQHLKINFPSFPCLFVCALGFLSPRKHYQVVTNAQCIILAQERCWW